MTDEFFVVMCGEHAINRSDDIAKHFESKGAEIDEFPISNKDYTLPFGSVTFDVRHFNYFGVNAENKTLFEDDTRYFKFGHRVVLTIDEALLRIYAEKDMDTAMETIEQHYSEDKFIKIKRGEHIGYFRKEHLQHVDMKSDLDFLQMAQVVTCGQTVVKCRPSVGEIFDDYFGIE